MSRFRTTTLLLAGITTLLCIAPSYAELTLDSEEFSIIVRNNANLGSGVHVHGGAYIGGDLTYSGANGSFGGDVNNGGTGLYVKGDVVSHQRLDVMGTNYHINGAQPSQIQNAGSEIGRALNEDAFFDEFTKMSTNLAGLSDSGVTVDSSDSNNVRFSVTANQLNVINLDSISGSFFTNQNTNVSFSNFTDDTFLVINYNLQDTLNFKAKNQNMPSFAYDNVIYNFVGDGDLVINQSVSTFKGSIMAVDSLVNWKANDIDGQLIADSLTWTRTSQSHFYTPWSNLAIMLPTEDLNQGDAGGAEDVPVPAGIGIILVIFAIISGASGFKRQT